jgi:ATP-binding cassette, subfamily C, bacterial CydC
LPDMAAYDLGPAVRQEIEVHENALLRARTKSVSIENLLLMVSSAVMAATLISVTLASRADNPALLAMALLGVTMGFENAGAFLQTLSQQRLFKAAERRIGNIYDLGDAPAPAKTEADRFTYKGQTVVVDRDLRLLISGESGAGKSRLIHALMGLAEPQQVPGLEGDAVFSRAMFSLCPQDAMTLSGTIHENLLMAIQDEALTQLTPVETEARLMTALEDAGLVTRLKSLKNGLDIWIGEGGITLSGGERKRLALARAYLRDAPILILDEPTEGLDATTEAFVIERLEARLSRTGQGLIFTSHRTLPRRLATSELTI